MSDAAGQVAAFGVAVEDSKESERVFFQRIIGNSDSSALQKHCKMDSKLVGKASKDTYVDEVAGVALPPLPL